MCGIVGYVGTKNCAELLVDGLRRLEYRGYDSAGLAVFDGSQTRVARAVGKLKNLEEVLRGRPLTGTTGIGHTRWATHGRVSEANAHPHVAGHIAVIHNGIIENHLELRASLEARGAKIVSDTDTEIVAHLIAHKYKDTPNLEDAVRAALKEIRGAYALAIFSEREPRKLVVAKNASPLVIGLGQEETLCGSDIPALLSHTRRMIILEDDQMAVLTPGGAELSTLDGEPIQALIRDIDWSPVMAEKSGYKHFMLKEIMEQPRALEDTLLGRLDRERHDVVGAEIGLTDADVAATKRIVLIACGTSHHAAMTGRYYLEALAKLPTVVEIASEFRSRDPVVGPGDLVVAISQSGETLDTLMAAKVAKEKGARVLAISNVVGSAIPRVADAVFYTRAGPEIGVASTKCFSTQLATMLMLAIYLGRRRETLSAERAADLIQAMAKLPHQMRDVLVGTRQLVANVAKRYGAARDVLFLGRGLNYPIALEGALKLKEITYVHAEGYAAGEMKHGPIALIDSSVPIFVICPQDAWRDKTLSNLQEAKAREGRVIAICTAGDSAVHQLSEEAIEVPEAPDEIAPFLCVLPLQLYAYYVADHKGTDVDQPRNLAKTVTVE